jgi:hypothetical protein
VEAPASGAHLLKYCRTHDVQFTRGRPYQPPPLASLRAGGHRAGAGRVHRRRSGCDLRSPDVSELEALAVSKPDAPGSAPLALEVGVLRGEGSAPDSVEEMGRASDAGAPGEHAAAESGPFPTGTALSSNALFPSWGFHVGTLAPDGSAPAEQIALELAAHDDAPTPEDDVLSFPVPGAFPSLAPGGPALTSPAVVVFSTSPEDGPSLLDPLSFSLLIDNSTPTSSMEIAWGGSQVQEATTDVEDPLAAPEPGTMLLVGSGALLLGLCGRRHVP